ncbi:MAG: ATP-binding cassette domain-containing protein, partial [Oscillospiraceae bacterium]|nr:ATP-binding cassette domain-containing protein [Oscillospiraceae bacterium]
MKGNKVKKGTIPRLVKMMFGFFPARLPFTIFCIIFSAGVSTLPAIFMQKIIALIEQNWQVGIWSNVSGQILRLTLTLACLYLLSLTSAFTYNRMMAVITQGTLKKLRVKMFDQMQRLPVKFFDSNNHGDIMSHYTNDIDALRQMISQSFPNLLISAITVISVLSIMLYYSVWMTLVVLLGVAVMLFAMKKIGGGSAKFFFSQQKAIGKVEGFIEETMNGQKVVKVFCHEEETEKDFDKLNTELFAASSNAHKYANFLGPVLNNIGNTLYVVVAIAGGLLLITNAPNLSFSGMAISISIVVPFLNMTKQFIGNINQVSHQINSVIMGLAGTARMFELMDQAQEEDHGYVTLVNAKEENGVITECSKRTGMWAWKHVHQADGSVTYTKLAGDVRLYDVDFGYDNEKTVLHDISLYAKPGQKVAFVGATGAGKTTITNLLNRFYDI